MKATVLWCRRALLTSVVVVLGCAALVTAQRVNRHRSVIARVHALGGNVHQVESPFASAFRVIGCSEIAESLRPITGVDIFIVGEPKSIDLDWILRHLSELEYLRIRNVQVSPDWEKRLPKLHRLRELSVEDVNVNDEMCRCIGRVPTLKALALEGTEVTDRGVVHLANLDSLENLVLSDTAIEGTTLRQLNCRTSLVWLGLADTSIGDEQLAELTRFSQLYFLDLSGCDVSDEGLAAISLSWLTILELNRTSVNGLGLQGEARFPLLETLSMTDTLVDDDGLKGLSDLMDLQRLFLTSAPVTGNGLCSLPDGLVVLGLRGTKVSDEHLACLGSLKRIQCLDLAHTAVGNPGVESLKDIPLRWLNLEATNVSDGAVEDLLGMSSLKMLCVSNTKITEDGMSQLDENVIRHSP